MNELLQLLNVNNTFFTVLGYPMSYIEFFGTLLNLACVWLIARKNILSWPIGIVATLLFGALFYQIQLYADLFEQVYYFITGIVGWVAWRQVNTRRANDEEPEEVVVGRNTATQNTAWLAGIAGFTALGSYVMINLDNWLPRFFPVPASLPVLDVFTTVLSFAAQIMLIQKRLENWVLWVIVDVIAIWLYWYKGVPFVSMLYAVFLVIATLGLVDWYKTYRRQQNG